MGRLKAWDPVLAAFRAVEGFLTVRDEANTQSEPAAQVIRFPDGTVFPHADGSVSVRTPPVGVIGCKAFHSTTQGSLAASTNNALNMDSEDWDTDGFHSTSSQTSRITIPASAGAGTYLIIGRAFVNQTFQPRIGVNGTVVASGDLETASFAGECMTVMRLNVGDYVEVMENHASGTGTAGSATRALGTELTVVRIGAGSVAGLPSARSKRTAGNLTLNNTSWTDVDTGTDLVVPAQVGDILLVSFSADWGNEAVQVGLDAATIVAGSPVNYVGTAGGASDIGVMAWGGANGDTSPAGGSVQYVVQSGDISGGNVTLRLRYRTLTATNKTLTGSTTQPLQFSVVNLKGGAQASSPYPSGTAFPTGPTSGQFYYRTDIKGGMLFQFDGTRWLSDQLFSFSSLFNDGSSSALNWGAGFDSAGLDVYLTRCEASGRVSGGTHNGSNHWVIRVYSNDVGGGGGGDNLLASSPTSFAQSATTMADMSFDVNSVVDVSATSSVAIHVTEVGASGTFRFYATLYWRFIAT